jgi:hypothetical protein
VRSSSNSDVGSSIVFLDGTWCCKASRMSKQLSSVVKGVVLHTVNVTQDREIVYI